MSSPTLLTKEGLRIAVEGCGHGTLHAIYASVKKSCELKGWDGVDLLIIGGDFQVRFNVTLGKIDIINEAGRSQRT